ncbi:coiled-coil domain-containing protein [Aspergillus affinis]|uniref:coiled-coil domain-containing protein n=1 Tax=Aspergillus affinis TaxID=1070780 RepID=UPI0022FE6EB9|nr:uncharacterized protein KD926_006238 [Aspergillus affinis]KAI9034739.1 hypothetical protein KD926_006238 [Aspergillus affinis]
MPIMPKRRADDLLENVSKSLRPSRDQRAVRIRQFDHIIRNGFSPSTSCEYCLSVGEECVMDRSREYSKCAACTRQGRVCRRDFHTENEWSLLRRAEDKLQLDIEKNDQELDLLEPELSELQDRLAALHQQVMSKQKQYQEAMARQRRLRKQLAFLKQRGFKMSEHDAELLRILDEQSGEPQPPVELVQLAASSDDPPNFTQMVEAIGQLSPSFWESFDPAVGGIAEPTGGTPSSSR